MTHLAGQFDHFGAHALLQTQLDNVTEHDTATAEILRTDYLSKGLDTNLTTPGNALHFKDLLTDLWYTVPIDQQVKQISQKVPSIFYYNYR